MSWPRSSSSSWRSRSEPLGVWIPRLSNNTMAIRPRAWERVVDVLPQIFPVNYALSGRMIVFRTAPGTELSYAPMTKVAFEIDDYDAPTGVCWSVMVQGVPHDALEALDDSPGRLAGRHPARRPGVK